MQRKEPAARLVDTFGDEVGGIDCAVIEFVLMLERIVDLSIGHGTGVEPHVDQVGLALHRLSRWRNKDNVVNIRTVQVYFMIVAVAVIAGHEALVFQRI